MTDLKNMSVDELREKKVNLFSVDAFNELARRLEEAEKDVCSLQQQLREAREQLAAIAIVMKEEFNWVAMHPAIAAALREHDKRLLEEAATECEVLADNYEKDEGNRYAELKTDATTGCNDCARELRRMAEEIK